MRAQYEYKGDFKLKKMMKAVVAVTMLLGSLLGAAPTSAIELSKITVPNMPIKVLFNARVLSSEVEPKIIEGTVLVPIRFVAVKMQAAINLQGNKITVVKGANRIELTINSKEAVINGKATTLAQPAQISNGRTLVPIRVISEGLNIPVEWDPNLRFVWVGNKDVPTLQEVVKGKIVDAAPYFKKYPYLQEYMNYNKDKTHLALLDRNDLPFMLHGEYHYRMDLAYIDGEQFLMSSSTDRGVMLTGYYYLTNNKKLPFRFRGANNRAVKGDLRINCYPIPSGADRDVLGEDYKKFTYKDIDYVGMNVDIDTGLIIPNPLR